MSDIMEIITQGGGVLRPLTTVREFLADVVPIKFCAEKVRNKVRNINRYLSNKKESRVSSSYVVTNNAILKSS